MFKIDESLRDPTSESVLIDEPIGPVRLVADAEYRRRAIFALGYDSDGVASPVVPPSMIACDLVALFFERYDPNRTVGLHQKEEVWFYKPIRIGAELEYTGRYTGKYEKRGKGYTVFESEARNVASGELCVRQISTEIMRIPAGIKVGTGSSRSKPGIDDHVEPNWPAERRPVERFSSSVSPGTPLVPLIRVAQQWQMTIFSGGDKFRHTVHTNIDIARQAGFRTTLAQGMMETCWFVEVLAGFIGDAWYRSGHIKTIFLHPVFEGDELTCKCIVTGVTAEEVAFELWAENQDAVVTTVGSAAWKRDPLMPN